VYSDTFLVSNDTNEPLWITGPGPLKEPAELPRRAVAWAPFSALAHRARLAVLPRSPSSSRKPSTAPTCQPGAFAFRAGRGVGLVLTFA
jgi:hypothetical protein